MQLSFAVLLAFLLPTLSLAAGKPPMKGMELYYWKASTGLERYSLVTGTNRTKTEKEIAEAGTSLAETRKNLAKLPSGTSVFISNGMHVEGGAHLGLAKPKKKVVKELKAYAATLGLVMEGPN